MATELQLFFSRGGGGGAGRILREPSFVKEEEEENKKNGNKRPKQNDFSSVFRSSPVQKSAKCVSLSWIFFLSLSHQGQNGERTMQKAVVIIVARYWSATRVPHELFTIHSDLQVPLSQIVDSLLRESRHADIPDTVLLPEGIPPSCQHRENVHTVSGSPNLFYTTRVIIFFSLSILRKQC